MTDKRVDQKAGDNATQIGKVFGNLNIFNTVPKILITAVGIIVVAIFGIAIAIVSGYDLRTIWILHQQEKLPDSLAEGILRVKVFNFKNHSSVAEQQSLGERFPGLILDQLLKREITFSKVNVDSILGHSLHIFQTRSGPDYEDSAYYNQLAPAVIVEGYIEESSKPDTFIAHIRVSLIEKQLSNVETGELAKGAWRIPYEPNFQPIMPNLKPIAVKEVTFNDKTMRSVANEVASQLYAKIKLRTEQLNAEAQKHISKLGTDESQQAMEELVKLGPTSIPSLLKAASNNQKPLRLHAIQVLGELRDPVLLPAYATFLGHSDAEIVSATLTSLWKLADGSETPVVENNLSRHYWRRRKSENKTSIALFEEPDFSFSFLKKSRLPKAQIIAPLIPELTKLLSTDQKINAYRAAIILSEMGDLVTVSQILTSLPTLPSDFHRDRVVLMLGKLGRREVITQLEEIAKQNQDLSIYAAIYLGWMGVRTEDDQLLKLLKDSRPVVQSAAAAALMGTKHPEAIDKLAEVINLREAQTILSTFGVEAAPSILNALKSAYSKLPDGKSRFDYDAPDNIKDQIWGAERVLKSMGATAYPLLKQVLHSDASTQVKYSVTDVIEDQCDRNFDDTPSDFVVQVGEDRLVKDLVELLLNTEVNEEHRMIRLNLVEALEGIASNRAVPGLKQALKRETSKQVQSYINRAIKTSK